MIRIDRVQWSSLSPRRRYALEMLLDLSRLVPAGPGVEGVPHLEVLDRSDRVELPALADGAAWKPVQGGVAIPAGALDLVTEIAGGAAEQRSAERDRHQRVPATANLLVQAGRERSPLVSRAAAALRRLVAAAAGAPLATVKPWPGEHRWAAALTHDVDVVSWWPLFTARRLLELSLRGEAKRFGRSIFAAVRASGGDPVLEDVRRILQLESSRSARTTWFFLAGTPTLRTAAAGDLTYRPESRRARSIVAMVNAAGHEVGLHGSFATYVSASTFDAERSRLAGVAGRPVRGVRQHFLRMVPGETQRAMHAAGFTYDATYGFSSRNGFRLGVADVVPGWDAMRDSPSGIDEIPLIWMDRALSKYRGVEDPGEWARDAMDLMSECESVEGLWVGLWHPNLSAAMGFPGAEAALEQVLATCIEQKAYVESLDRIHRWRRLRRSLRIEAVGTDGHVRATVDGDALREWRPGAVADLALEREGGATSPPMEVTARRSGGSIYPPE